WRKSARGWTRSEPKNAEDDAAREIRRTGPERLGGSRGPRSLRRVGRGAAGIGADQLREGGRRCAARAGDRRAGAVVPRRALSRRASGLYVRPRLPRRGLL